VSVKPGLPHLDPKFCALRTSVRVSWAFLIALIFAAPLGAKFILDHIEILGFLNPPQWAAGLLQRVGEIQAYARCAQLKNYNDPVAVPLRAAVEASQIRRRKQTQSLRVNEQKFPFVDFVSEPESTHQVPELLQNRPFPFVERLHLLE
jgi:hypothetical protein